MGQRSKRVPHVEVNCWCVVASSRRRCRTHIRVKTEEGACDERSRVGQIRWR
jgi:hypothetical protein